MQLIMRVHQILNHRIFSNIGGGKNVRHLLSNTSQQPASLVWSLGASMFKDLSEMFLGQNQLRNHAETISALPAPRRSSLANQGLT
jgi:hypothetical protein